MPPKKIKAPAAIAPQAFSLKQIRLENVDAARKALPDEDLPDIQVNKPDLERTGFAYLLRDDEEHDPRRDDEHMKRAKSPFEKLMAKLNVPNTVRIQADLKEWPSSYIRGEPKRKA